MNQTLSGNSQMAMKENATWEVALGATHSHNLCHGHHVTLEKQGKIQGTELQK